MNIYVINTGGTISCVGNPLAPMTAAQFAAACQEILNPIIEQQFPDIQITYVTDLTFPELTTGTLDSTNLQPTDWCLMAGYILNHYTECDGWVVLHGTDSMDFTGTALPFLLSSFSSPGILHRRSEQAGHHHRLAGPDVLSGLANLSIGAQLQHRRIPELLRRRGLRANRHSRGLHLF